MKEEGETYDPAGTANARQSGRFEQIGRSWDRRLQHLGAGPVERCVRLLATGRRRPSAARKPSETCQGRSDRPHEQDVAPAAGRRASHDVVEPGITNLMEREIMSRSDELTQAQAAILAVVAEDPSHRWTSFDLRTAAYQGGNHGVLGVALDELIEEGRLHRSPEDNRIFSPEASAVGS